MVKALLFLAGEKGYTALNSLLADNRENVFLSVVSFRESNMTESYYERIENLCKKEQVEFTDWKDMRPKLIEYIADRQFTFAAAIAWKYLLPLEMNRYLMQELIVFHDSLLPKYRGFAPTPTAVINGEKQTGVSVLFAGEKADNGDLIFQESMSIGKEEYISEVIQRQSLLYAELLKRIFRYLQEGKALPRIKQDETKATYSIWRSPEDCRIDWNKSALEIFNLVRAVGKPYSGAYTFYDGNKVFIDRVCVCEEKIFEIRQPGKIWKNSENCPEVICGTGMLRIVEAHDESGKDFIFQKLRVRFQS